MQKQLPIRYKRELFQVGLNIIGRINSVVSALTKQKFQNYPALFTIPIAYVLQQVTYGSKFTPVASRA